MQILAVIVVVVLCALLAVSTALLVRSINSERRSVAALEEVSAEYSDHVERTATATRQMESEFESRIEVMETNQREMSKTIEASVKQKVDDLNAQLETAQNLLSSTMETETRLASELAQARNLLKNESKRADALTLQTEKSNRERASFEHRIKTADENVARVEKANKDLSATLAEVRSKLFSVENALTKVNDQQESAALSAEALIQERDALTRELSTQVERAEKSSSQLAALKKDVATLTKDRNKFKRSSARYKKAADKKASGNGDTVVVDGLLESLSGLYEVWDNTYGPVPRDVKVQILPLYLRKSQLSSSVRKKTAASLGLKAVK